MNKYTQALQSQLNNCGSAAVFEFEVIDEEGETDFITCDVYFKGNSIDLDDMMEGGADLEDKLEALLEA